MRGVLLVQLQRYIQKRFNEAVWRKILQAEGIPEYKIYFSNEHYADEEFFFLVSRSIDVTGLPMQDLLEGFGIFLGEHLFTMFKSFILPSWKTLDLIENLEEFNYNILQKGIPSALAGKFTCRRINSQTIICVYSSPRQLCGIAVGLFKAIAAQYKENIFIHHTYCMLRGDSTCEFHLTLLPPQKV